MLNKSFSAKLQKSHPGAHLALECDYGWPTRHSELA